MKRYAGEITQKELEIAVLKGKIEELSFLKVSIPDDDLKIWERIEQLTTELNRLEKS